MRAWKVLLATVLLPCRAAVASPLGGGAQGWRCTLQAANTPCPPCTSRPWLPAPRSPDGEFAKAVRHTRIANTPCPPCTQRSLTPRPPSRLMVEPPKLLRVHPGSLATLPTTLLTHAPHPAPLPCIKRPVMVEAQQQLARVHTTPRIVTYLPVLTSTVACPMPQTHDGGGAEAVRHTRGAAVCYTSPTRVHAADPTPLP